MFTSDRIIALDIGASKVVVAEFLAARGRPPQLLAYGIGELGVSPESDGHSPALVVSTLREQMRAQGIRPGPLFMTVSGQAVFPRFVRLPPVTRDKLVQMVRYEAEQNVPFPIDEVVWDYQLIGGEEGHLNVMLVAVKIENVMRLTDCVQANRLEPEIVDAAPMALCNCVRHNYPDLPGCTLVLDIGARSSNLIFIEGDRLFSRSVPVAGNAITQEVAKAFDCGFPEAEALKREHALVGLGGVSAGPEGDTADRVAKIVRNVVTRLHAEVNRSINFYRGQQGGSAPSRVLLSGGSSVIPNADTFFEDKLHIPVEPLNPFQNVTVGPAISEERIGRDVQVLGEVVGLALRRLPSCPIQINLMPPNLVAAKTFRRRQPFFAAAAAAVLLSLAAAWGLANRLLAQAEGQLKSVGARIVELKRMDEQFRKAAAARQAIEARAGSLAELVRLRSQWLEVFESLHTCLLPDMWLVGVRPVAVDGGRAVEVEITVRGFEDTLRKLDQTEATAAELFRDQLKASPLFADAAIRRLLPLGPKDYVREFTLWAKLKTPLVLE